MTNEEIIQRGILIRDETEPAQNTSTRVGGVIEGIGRNLADKDTAIEAQAARNGYYQCTVSGTTLAVTAPGFTLPAHGGNIRIKMSAPATGACTLNINSTGPKALLYNGAALSSANTWEQNEIISVFYDPSGSGQYLASNSQGGGGKAEKIKYDNSQSGLASDNVQGAMNEVVDDTEFEEQIAKLSFFSAYADTNYPLLAGHKYRFDIVLNAGTERTSMAVKRGDGTIIKSFNTANVGNSVIYKAEEDSQIIRSALCSVNITELVMSGNATEDCYSRTDVIESSIVINKNSCVIHAALKADGTIQTSGVTSEYYISNYTELPNKANKIVYSGILPYSAALSYGCLYDSSKSLLYRFQGDGIIDLANYPSAKYIAIGIRTNMGDINPIVEIQSIIISNEASVIDTRNDVVLHNQNECVTVGAISGKNGIINTSIADTSYLISNYIDLEGYDYCQHSLWNEAEGTNFAGAALYDESYNPVKVLVGEGLVYLKDYPDAKYIVIALHSSHRRVSVELGKGYRMPVKSLAEKIPKLEETLMYESGKGTQNAGNIDTTVNQNSGNDYYAMGVAGSAAEYDGNITSVSFCAQNTGTIHFMIGVWDETHEYFNPRATYNHSVSSTGNQTMPVNIPILQGETLMVNMSSGVKIKLKSYSSSTPPVGSKNAIISIDGGQIYHKYGPLRTYLYWTIAWEFEQTVKEKVTENANDIEAVENECEKIGQQVSELANSKQLIQGNDGKVYRLVVTDGILGIENTTPQNILILAHSFACILTGVWQRGMSSSKIATDWVSQMDTVFLPTTVNRVNMVAWEQAFPNPSSQLSSLNTYLTASVDAIFIMCGANVASAYRTQQYGQTNYAELVNYCKERATNADVYVCSPGYTPETDGFNIGIKAGAESAGATYISTYSTQADKLANFGDVVWNANDNAYTFVINSNGRVNHPNDIWHLFMANNILNSLGYSTLDKYRSISYNANVDYRGYARWVAGGHCTFCTFGNSRPTVSIVDANNNPISYEIMDLSGVTWENTPPSIPKWAVHFDMPDSNVTISIS